MKIFKNWLFLTLMFILTLFFVSGCSSSSDSNSDTESASEEPASESVDAEDEVESSGELHVALNASPPTLDPPMSTAALTRDTSKYIFEGLLTTDSDFKPVPMLAESVDTDDNKVFTFKLREGVKFHNGEEMTAEDVIVSMERWMEKSASTGTVFDGATWKSEDDYTVVLTLEKASSLTLDMLASSSQAAAIMPKDIIESASEEGVNEYIGTGPYELVEWVQDQHIHISKYDDYQPLEMEADGLAGKKEALIEDIYMHIVPDNTTRLAGLQSGEYDYAFDLSFDNFEQIENDPNLNVEITPSTNHIIGFNKVEGLSSDFEFRQIINTAIDVEEIMLAAFPNEDFFWLDSGYMHVDIANWASDAGSEYYNQNDPEKAKEMLEEIGYDDEEFRIMVSRDYDRIYNSGVVLQEQLKQIGINAVLDVYDWPTVTDLRENDFSAWDVHITGINAVSTPIQLIPLSETWSGGVNDEYISEILKEIEFAPSLEESQELWNDLQLYAWEEHLPIIQLGGFSKLFASSKHVNDVTTFAGGPTFWNATISQE